MLIALILALVVALPVGAQTARTITPVTSIDSVEANARAVLAIGEFFAEWQRLWQQSEIRRAEDTRHRAALRLRLPYLHCHSSVQPTARKQAIPSNLDSQGRPFTQFPLIGSFESAFAVCPTWVLGGGTIPEASDEAGSRDNALTPAFRGRAFNARGALIASLESATAAWPGSQLLTGQVVRFRVDQLELDGAAKAARNCRAVEWWCLALTGYVLAQRGATIEADSVYTRMRAAMTAQQRCEWIDVRSLLAVTDVPAFAKLGCPERTCGRDFVVAVGPALSRARQRPIGCAGDA